MAQQIPDWLGPLVEAELQAAVDWYSPNIVKRDPDARFRDDGSNYHNVVESEKFSAESKVQIVQVLPDEDVMILSDGSTCLRTRLSARAKTALETELDGAIHADVRGDVFAIKKATLVSTPYGPGDRKVQLVVDDLQYHFMLRKITGQPQPVEKRPEVMRLIREMLRLRSPTQEPEARAEKRPKTNATMAQQFSRQKQPDDMHVQSPRSQVSVRSAAMRSSPSQIYTQLRDTRPVISSPMQVSTQTRDTRPAVGSSPPQVDTQMRDTQPTIATQAPIRRKKHGLNLQSDGVELAAGVNLERPTAAVQSYRLQSNLAAPLGMPGGLSDDKAQLLSVLGKRKAAPEAQAQNVTKPIAPKPVAPEAQGLPDYVDSPDADAGVAHALENGPEPMALPEYHGPSESSAPKTIATAFEQRNVTVSATPRPSYWRRPQPYAQRKLLDSPSSWFPSRPGREFPMPNVPIELLKVWNEQVEAQSLKPSQPPDVSQHIAGERAGEEAVDSESHSSASEDEELPWSSSPARSAPLKARPENQSKVQVGHLGMPLSSAPLSSSPQEPPDSSIGSRTGDGNPNRQDLPPDSSNDRVPYPLPRRPAFSPQKAQQQSPPSGQSNGQLSQQSAHSAAGSPMQIRPSTATPIRPKASSATQRDGLSQAFVKDVPSTQGMPTNPPSAIPRNSEGHSRPSTAGSVSAGNFVSTKSGSNSAQEAIAKAKSAAAERVASYEPRSAAPPSPNNQIRQSEIDHLQRARFPSSRTLINPARSGARPTSGDQNATQHSLPALTRPSSSSRPPAPVDRRPFETPNTPSYPRPESRSSAASQRWGDSYRPGYKHRSDTYRSDRRWSDAYRDDRSENDRPGSRGDTYRPTYLNRPNQPSSSASLMVKATQPSTHDPPSKDLETDIARPVDPTVRHEKGPPSKDLKTDVARPVDPAVQHQKRRSEHFKSIQRRDWLKKNSNISKWEPLALGPLHRAYKIAHPNDHPRLSEFLDAYTDVWKTKDSPPAQDPVTDAQTVAETPEKVASKPASEMELVDLDHGLPFQSPSVHPALPKKTAVPTNSKAQQTCDTSNVPRRSSGRVLPEDWSTPTLNGAGSLKQNAFEATPASAHISDARDDPANRNQSVHEQNKILFGSARTEQERAMNGSNDQSTTPDANKDRKCKRRPKASLRPPGMSRRQWERQWEEAHQNDHTPNPPAVSQQDKTAKPSTPAAEQDHNETNKTLFLGNAQSELSRATGNPGRKSGNQDQGSTFRDFVQAFKNIKPGGAFARAEDDSGTVIGMKLRNGKRGRMDVLKWGTWTAEDEAERM